jgi:predicted ATPase
VPKNYILKEYGSEIITPNKDTISPFFLVKNIAYIDSPMMLGVGNNVKRFSHWEDLNRILHKKSHRINDKSLDEIFKKQILKGEASISEDSFSNKFIYKRKDGKEFDLLECATGIKSFAVLQILFKNGFLTNKTLLIIDEPEAHLHPQWVVEYARLIVLLHKHIGVRFLIASHHPDMVSAIKYISEKEQVDDKLHYYLAEQTGEEFKYNYKELGTDIEAIFESFNIAFERMDLYGNTE